MRIASALCLAGIQLIVWQLHGCSITIEVVTTAAPNNTGSGAGAGGASNGSNTSCTAAWQLIDTYQGACNYTLMRQNFVDAGCVSNAVGNAAACNAVCTTSAQAYFDCWSPLCTCTCAEASGSCPERPAATSLYPGLTWNSGDTVQAATITNQLIGLVHSFRYNCAANSNPITDPCAR